LFLLRALDPEMVPPELFGLAYRLLGGAFIGPDDARGQRQPNEAMVSR